MNKELTDEQIVAKAIDTFRKQAQTAFDNHQETGEARYHTAFVRYEAIADALVRDAEKTDYRQALGDMRATLAMLTRKIDRLTFMPYAERLVASDKLLAEFSAYAKMEGLIS